MRIFLAGATGVIGARLLPRLLAAGHSVAAMTRTAARIPGIRALGATPVLCNVFDREALIDAVAAFAPDVVLHQLTDLPDRLEQLAEFMPANNRIRGEGTRNLVAAVQAAGASQLIAQSIAWRRPGIGPVIDEHEASVLSTGGTVLRYGQFYGPDTYYADSPPPPPRIHVDEAARRTLPFIDGPRGTFTLTDEGASP